MRHSYQPFYLLDDPNLLGMLGIKTKRPYDARKAAKSKLLRGGIRISELCEKEGVSCDDLLNALQIETTSNSFKASKDYDL